MASDNQPIRGFVTLTAGGGAKPQGRIFRINATLAGDVIVVLHDGSTETITFPVGYSAYPYQVVSVTSTTGTATFANGL